MLVAWKGRRDPDEEAELERGAPRLAMELVELRAADPYAGSRNRHLYLMRKTGPTPEDLPRRAGMAKKRPRGRDLDSPGVMGYVYAIANQKGGVGKTTTTVNLAACVAETGRQTLVVDLDPQCNATVTLGLDREAQAVLLRHALRRGLGRRGRPADGSDNLWVVPANRDLAGASVELPGLDRTPTIDCATDSARSASASRRPSSTARRPSGRSRSTRWPPPTGWSSPSRPSTWRSRGSSSSSTRCRRCRRRLNPSLVLTGIAITMADDRTRLSQDVEHELKDHFTDLVLETVIPRSVRLAEAPSFGVPVIAHAPDSRGADRLPGAGRGGARPWLGRRAWAAAWRRSCPIPTRSASRPTATSPSS